MDSLSLKPWLVIGLLAGCATTHTLPVAEGDAPLRPAAHVALAVVDERPEVREAARAALSSVDVINASRLYDTLHPIGIDSVPDMGWFEAPPPFGWLTELDELWATDLAACRGALGDPPWLDAMTSVFRYCGKTAGSHLWFTYLTTVQAERVFVITTTYDRDGSSMITGHTYVPAGTMVRSLTLRSTKDSAATVTTVIARLLDGEGARSTRSVTRVFAVPSADPYVGQTSVLTADEPAVKGACAAVPARLKVSPASTLARALEARWAAAAPGVRPEEPCTLTTTEGEEGAGLTVLAGITCGKVTAGAAAKKSEGVDAVAKALVVNLSARMCQPARR